MHRRLRQLAVLTVAAAVAVMLLMTMHRPMPALAAKSSIPSLVDPDVACARCHAAIYNTYEKTPMARGSGLAVDGLIPGDFTHAESGIHYRIFQRDGMAWLSYDRPPNSKQGVAIKGERRLDYFIGSGKRGRTYLFNITDAQNKLWFEAPINWYTKRALWDMAPAYEHAATMPITLPVDANCLHCHAGNVQLPQPAIRNVFHDQPFASAGVGCASCHGDATAHLASNGNAPVLNPKHLATAQRDSICLQCHLEGDAVVYRTGHSLASFKAGDDLAETAVYFVNRNSPKSTQRASSQYEALLRSACKRAVGDKLTCTTCHDPHASPVPEQRVVFFRGKCLLCHNTPAIATNHHPEQKDCAFCHMPTRDTADISHEQLTDHNIERRPGSNDARLALHTLEGNTDDIAAFSAAADLVPVGNTIPSDRERGLAYAQFAARGDHTAAQRAISLLKKVEFSNQADAEVHEQLGFLLQQKGNVEEARKEYGATLAANPNRSASASNLAVIEADTGDIPSAIHRLQQIVSADGTQTAAALNLAFLQCKAGRQAEARTTIQHALQFNPDDLAANRFSARGQYAGQHCALQ